MTLTPSDKQFRFAFTSGLLFATLLSVLYFYIWQFDLEHASPSELVHSTLLSATLFSLASISFYWLFNGFGEWQKHWSVWQARLLLALYGFGCGLIGIAMVAFTTTSLLSIDIGFSINLTETLSYCVITHILLTAIAIVVMKWPTQMKKGETSYNIGMLIGVILLIAIHIGLAWWFPFIYLDASLFLVYSTWLGFVEVLPKSSKDSLQDKVNRDEIRQLIEEFVKAINRAQQRNIFFFGVATAAFIVIVFWLTPWGFLAAAGWTFVWFIGCGFLIAMNIGAYSQACVRGWTRYLTTEPVGSRTYARAYKAVQLANGMQLAHGVALQGAATDYQKLLKALPKPEYILSESMNSDPRTVDFSTRVQSAHQTTSWNPPDQRPANYDDAPSNNKAAGDSSQQSPASLAFGYDFAVQIAYEAEIKYIASVLQSGLSALIQCDKLVVNYLADAICVKANLDQSSLDKGVEIGKELNILGAQLFRLREIFAKPGDQVDSNRRKRVLVLRNLDLLAGSGGCGMTAESRELTQLVYDNSDHLILAFFDPTIDVPEVLAARFAIRRSIIGVPSRVTNNENKLVPIGTHLLSVTERRRIAGFDPERLYQNIAGMNPIQIRNAVVYAFNQQMDGQLMDQEKLVEAIRAFKKAGSSMSFEVPNIGFNDIGGYTQVKKTLRRALRLMHGAEGLDESLRRELAPRGFIFYGPPGTGKTLFAKAVANTLEANLIVVSGPETLNKWYGESERQMRELFAEARRNAPSVLVFDEFDAIASERVGGADGGSRASNSVVAQILTEMDGFRPDVPMLIIGTTNRIDIIDEALLRPSRFQSIEIGLPDKSARRSIAEIYAKKFGFVLNDSLFELIVRATENFNGDEIKSIFREALIEQKLGDESEATSMAKRLGKQIGKIRFRIERENQQYGPRIFGVRDNQLAGNRGWITLTNEADDSINFEGVSDPATSSHGYSIQGDESAGRPHINSHANKTLAR